MLIQELEQKTGLDRPTIRYYEKEGLICPTRAENGYRQYADSDVENLLRIKLMRQLGISIGKIKDLQCGAEDFSAVISAQIVVLKSQIERDTRASAVCTAILSDRAKYATIKSEYYLKMLNQQDFAPAVERAKFKEYIPEQIHPWRRYFARILDYLWFTMTINFVFTVVLRIRPAPASYNLVQILSPILYAAMFIPIEALFLHLWGTTPGKLSMGVRIERIEGGRLSYSDAMERSKSVFFFGMGLRIPIISEITMIKRYCELTGSRIFGKHNSIDPPYEMQWDYNNEIHYHERAGKRHAALACILAVSIALMGISILDSVEPRYRSGELTLEEFSKNYNVMVHNFWSEADSSEKLDSSGNWCQRDRNVIYLELGSRVEDRNKNFTYILDDSKVQSVSYSQNWSDVTILSPVGDRCYLAAITMLMSQRGTNFLDLVRFEKIWQEEVKKSNAVFQYENIRIQWAVAVDGKYTHFDSVYYAVEKNLPLKVSLEFTASIIE